MLDILNSLNAPSFPIFQPILIILVSKFMIHTVLSDKTHLSLGLLSPLTDVPAQIYSKTCVKRPLKNRQNKDLNNNW